MGIIGKIFGSTKSMETAVSGGISLLDNAFHTDQEKTVERIEMVKSLQDQFTPRSITRRILAVIIYANMFLHINVYLFKPSLFHSIDDAKEILIKEIELGMIVTFFYFGYYGVKKVMNMRK